MADPVSQLDVTAVSSAIPKVLLDFVTTPSSARTATCVSLGALALFNIGSSWSHAYSRKRLNNSSLKDTYAWDVPGKELVLITGGTSGLGDATARKLAARGIRVVCWDIHPPETPFPSNVSWSHVDVTDTKAIRVAAEKLRNEVGLPTVLVNNAGVGNVRGILDGTEEETRHTFDVNVMAHFNMLREFLPAMIKANHGHVVNIASMASYVTIADNTDYSCSKAALLALHEGLGQEIRWRHNAPNVRTSIIHPAWVKTPLIEDILKIRPWRDTLMEAEPVVDAIVNQILKGESGQVILPSKFNTFGPLLRAMPSWMAEMIRDTRGTSLQGLKPLRTKKD